VDFAGWVDHKEIGGYYRRCAVFVLPSIFTDDGGYEPFSNVVLEAMAWGAPVITTLANGAAYDVLEDGVNGRVVPDREPEALAAALGDLLADPSRAEAMGRRGRETVRERFNVDRMAERFGEALDCGLAAAGRSPRAP
jgi:glycosyltransferase involved in cell wall biosynthesis